MENRTRVDKYNKNHIMRIFVDTGVPVKYMSNNDVMDTVINQLLSNINSMDTLNNTLFDGKLTDTINKTFLFSSIVCSQVLRDIDKYDIRNIADVIKYVQRKNIANKDLRLNIAMIAMVEGNNELGMSTIISLIGLSLTSYLEDNTPMLSNIMDSIDVYMNTLDVDDLVYNI